MEDSAHLVNENMILSSASESEAAKKKGSRPKTAESRVNKPKRAPRKPKVVEENGARKTIAKAAATKRKASERQADGDTQLATKKTSIACGVQSEDELDGPAGPEEPRGETIGKPRKKAKGKRDMKVVDDDCDDSPNLEQVQMHGTKKPRNVQNATANDPQPTFQELDSNAGANNTCSPQHPVNKPVRSRSRSRQEAISTGRAAHASESEKGVGDPNLRRKLGDITRKFENVDSKYRTLRDVGILEANANMEKLRKQCEATTSASGELVASLKKELAMQMPLAQEARQLQIDLRNSENEASKYRATVSDLESSLTAAQNEIKALQAKLAAARSSAISGESINARTPASAMKNSNHFKNGMVGSAEASQAAQTAQLKEDLYSDLTGLIIRSVKKTEEGDAYDCIQTGRNGSKYFGP